MRRPRRSDRRPPPGGRRSSSSRARPRGRATGTSCGSVEEGEAGPPPGGELARRRGSRPRSTPLGRSTHALADEPPGPRAGGRRDRVTAFASRRRRQSGSRRSTTSTTTTGGALGRSGRTPPLSEPRERCARRRALRGGERVRVGVDISPLVQTRAGTARHVRGLVGALRGRPGSTSSSCRSTARVASRASPDALWYPVGLTRRARELDLLHCTTFRGPRGPPSRPSSPCTTSRSCATPRRSRAGIASTAEPACGSVLRAATPSWPCRSSRRTRWSRSPGSPPSVSASSRTASTRSSRPEGPRSDGEYVLAVATLEPRKNLGRAVEAARSRASSSASSVPAAGAASTSRAGSARSRRRARAPLPRRALRRSTRRCTRASGSRCSRRWRAALPVVTSSGTAMEEVAGGAAVLVDPLEPESIADGIAEAEARRDELVRSVSRVRAVHVGAARPTRSRRSGGSSRERARRRRRRRPRPRAHRATRRTCGTSSASSRRSPGKQASGWRRSRAGPTSCRPASSPWSCALARRSCAWPGPCHARSSGSTPTCAHAVRLPLRAPCPCVVTVHDLSFVRRPELMGWKDRLVFRRVVPRAARRAERVLTVSERTKRDLVELYGVPATRSW